MKNFPFIFAVLLTVGCYHSLGSSEDNTDTLADIIKTDEDADSKGDADNAVTGFNGSELRMGLMEQWDDWEKELVAKSYTEVSSKSQLAAWYCLRMGGDVFDDNEDRSSPVKCELPEGTKCDTSFFYFGTCALEQSACTQMGYELIIDKSNPSNYMVYCVTGTQEQILLFDVVEQLP